MDSSRLHPICRIKQTMGTEIGRIEKKRVKVIIGPDGSRVMIPLDEDDHSGFGSASLPKPPKEETEELNLPKDGYRKS